MDKKRYDNFCIHTFIIHLKSLLYMMSSVIFAFHKTNNVCNKKLKVARWAGQEGWVTRVKTG